MSDAPIKTVKLGPLGSVLFGAMIFGIGLFFKRYLGEGEMFPPDQSLTLVRAGLGAMIVGGLIIAWNVIKICVTIYFVITKGPR